MGTLPYGHFCPCAGSGLIQTKTSGDLSLRRLELFIPSKIKAWWSDKQIPFLEKHLTV